MQRKIECRSVDNFFSLIDDCKIKLYMDSDVHSRSTEHSSTNKRQFSFTQPLNDRNFRLEASRSLNCIFQSSIFPDYKIETQLQVKKFKKTSTNPKSGSVVQSGFFEQLKTITILDFGVLKFALLKFSWLFRGRSQTTFTRGGGQVVKKIDFL